MSLDMFYLIYAGVLGLLVGSFLNVVILRLPPYLMWHWKHANAAPAPLRFLGNTL